MKTLSILSLVASFAFGCAATGTADHLAVPTRGAVSVAGVARKAIVAGPTTIHAYSGFAGGEIYTAPAVTGTDSDCGAVDGGHTQQSREVGADRVMTIDVGAGDVACLATKTDRRFELLWHVQNGAQRAPVLVAREQ
ncbi:MAG TPA: hypothetical protein VH374_21500 [Polyangia bacterium]|jgi:hypothetical protein|nr:hypothetical protein [Polyangia bacterium]